MPDTMSSANHAYSLPFDMIVSPTGEVEILCHLQRGQLGGSSFVADTARAYIVTYNTNGDIIGLVKPDLNWRQVAGDGKNPTSLGNIRMAKTKSGKYVVSGRLSYNPQSPGDPLVMGGQLMVYNMFAGFFDKNWNNLWHKQNTSNYAGSLSYRPLIDKDENIIFGGGTNKVDVFAGYTVTNSLTTLNTGLPTIYKLDTFGNLVFARNMEANSTNSGVAGVDGNHIYLSGGFRGEIQIGNFSLSNPSPSDDIYLAIFNLRTGFEIKLDSLKGISGYDDDVTAVVADHRSNIYLGGELGYNMTIGSTTIQSAGGTSDFFVAKYGAANCSDSPVPLQLTAFTANWRGNDVLTRWQTAQEQNTKAFIVQRSNDAFRFDSIGTVAAKGNSNTTRQYTFTDFAPLSSDNLPSGQAGQQLSTVNSLFYRLKMLDRDGAFTYSPVAMVSLAASKGISIYPNPARNVAVVSYELTLGDRQPVLEVYNITGHKLQAVALSVTAGSFALNVSALPAGIYQVVLRSNGRVAAREKLVVDRLSQ